MKDLKDFRQLLVQLMPDEDLTEDVDVHHQLFEFLYPDHIPDDAERVERVK